MKRKILIVLAAALLAAGCILTGTVVITAKLVPDPNPVTVTEDSFDEGEMEVDLNGDSDFEKYKDNIKDIDNIGFYLDVTNNLTEPVTFQLLLDADTSSNWTDIDSAVAHGIDVIFTDLTLAGHETKIIDWGESIKYISSLEDLKEIVESGVFSIYPAAIPREDFSVTIDSLVVIITLTGSE